MKKLLALVMALVMVLGLATVGTSAAYADQDDINYEEAVDVMTAIGVLGGDETGFRPADTLKRSEGAKIVAYLMLGNKAAEAIQASGTKYTDLPANHWAAGYMEYLTSVGVMGGIGDGKIDPDGQLTATAFGKMLLTALGYDAEIEGLGGPDWALNTQKLANQIGLYDGNRDVVGSAAVTREEAALYAFNTIKAPIVEYDTNVRVDTGASGIVTVGSSKPQYVISGQAYAGKIDTETATVNGATNTRVEFAEQYYKDLELVGNGAQQYNDLGEPVNTWTYNNIEIGTYVAKAGLIATFTKKVTAKDLYDLVGKSRVDSLLANQTVLGVFEDGVLKALLGKNATAATAENVANYLSRNDTIQVSNTGNGSVTEVFLNADNDINVVTYHTYVFQAEGDYNATTQTLYIEAAGDTANVIPTLAGGETTLSAKDFPEIADLKNDDYILVNVATAAANHGAAGPFTIQKIAKAELKTGEVSAYKADTNVTIGGTAVAYSEKTLKAANNGVRGTNYSVGQSTTVVLDAAGYIIAVDEAVVNPNYVFVTKFGSTSGLGNDLYATAYFTDGTTEAIKVDKVYDASGNSRTKATLTTSNTVGLTDEIDDQTSGSFRYAGWYTYGKNSDGSYTLYQPKAASLLQFAYSYGANTNVTANDKVLFVQNSGTDQSAGGTNNVRTAVNTNADNTIRVNSKTVFVVNNENEDSVYTYTGVKNTPDITTKAGTGRAFVMAAYNPDNLYASYVFITAKDANIYDGSDEALLYVVGQEGTYYRSGNQVYYKWNIVDENTKVSTIDAKIPVPTGLAYEAVYRVRKNADGEITNAVEIETPQGGAGGVNPLYADGKYFNFGALVNGGPGGNAGTGKITYNNNTLWLNGLPFTLADDAKITLVVTNGAPALLDDKGATREAKVVSASTLASKLNNYPLAQYSAQGRLDDVWGSSTEIHELYVTVGSSAYTSVVDGTSATLNADITSALAVTGANVYVTNAGTTVLTGALTIPSGKSLTFQGNLNTSSNPLTINGTMNVGGNLVDSGHIDLSGTLSVAGTTSISGTSLALLGNATATLKQGVTITGTLTTSAGSKLYAATEAGDVTITGSAAKVILAGETTVGSSDKNAGADLKVTNSATGANVVLGGDIEVYDAFEVAAAGTVINGDVVAKSASATANISTSSTGSVKATAGTPTTSGGSWTGASGSIAVDDSSSAKQVSVSYSIGDKVLLADYPTTASGTLSGATVAVTVGSLTQMPENKESGKIYVTSGDAVALTITITATGSTVLPTSQSYFSVDNANIKINSYEGTSNKATLKATYTK